MDVSLYSYPAQAALHQGLRYAKGLGHDYFEIEHVALAILRKDWDRLEAQSHGRLEKSLEDFLQKFPKKFGQVKVAFGPRLNQALNLVEASVKDRLIEIDDIWPNLIASSQAMQSSLTLDQEEQKQDFQSWNITDIEKVKKPSPPREKDVSSKPRAVRDKDQSGSGEAPPSKDGSRKLDAQLDQVLRLCTIDFTELASRGEIDPVIGRDSEIRRVLEILGRKKKNNPILLGPPGVGKTAIAEGIALRIVQDRVPENLRGVRVLSLDIGVLLAGTRYRGDFEEKLKQLVKAIESLGERVILFIDEIHTILGAGQSEGGADAANLLKPALARGTLRCLGATTLVEYRRYFEKDAALERRFQPIQVREPDRESTLSILRGLKPRYEIHHGVPISDEALQVAVDLSILYLPQRQLPDKAIDLIDEAAARLKLLLHSVPLELEKIQSQIAQLKVEQQALERQGSRSKALGQAKVNLERLSEEGRLLESAWRRQQEQMAHLKSLEQELDEMENLHLSARAHGDFDLAAKLQYGELPKLQEKLSLLQKELEGQSDLESRIVDKAAIARVLENWTGIPVGQILQDEKERLKDLEAALASKVYGQGEALEVLARAVRRARVGLGDPERPLGVFFFLGPTGVGKTETAKALAELLFQNRKNLIRIDMSEFMEAHQVSGLIGAPPGYTGFESGGRLTDAVRHNPFSIVLLDEVDKAHPRVLDILLQLFDEGRLTDGQGRLADFRRCMIIMTSNIYIPLAGVQAGERDRYLRDELSQNLRPELVNRIDEIISFRPLGRKDFEHLLHRELRDLNRQLLDKEIRLELGPGIVEMLLQSAVQSNFAGRELKRGFQRWVLDAITDRLLDVGEPLQGYLLLDWDRVSGLSWRRDDPKTRYLPPAR